MYYETEICLMMHSAVKFRQKIPVCCKSICKTVTCGPLLGVNNKTPIHGQSFMV